MGGTPLRGNGVIRPLGLAWAVWRHAPLEEWVERMLRKGPALPQNETKTSLGKKSHTLRWRGGMWLMVGRVGM